MRYQAEGKKKEFKDRERENLNLLRGEETENGRETEWA